MTPSESELEGLDYWEQPPVVLSALRWWEAAVTRLCNSDLAPRSTPPGPAAPPYCDYCERGRPAGVGPSYRDGCPKHDPAMRAALEEDIYEAALIELAHLDDDAMFDLRWLLPHPERVPAEVDTWTTMGEFRARIREIRSER